MSRRASRSARRRAALATGLFLLAVLAWVKAQSDPDWGPRLVLRVVDHETGEPVAARFSLAVDGQTHEPRWVGPHGLRFVSVHVSKRQTFLVTYSRGTGPVEAPLKAGARSVEVRVTKGLDYVPVMVQAPVNADPVEVEVRLRRWNRLREQGWRAADTHLHYDRIEPAGDRDWFDAMDGDGLTHAQFLMLKGGMVPGIWARQFAYGKRGEGTDGERLIVPGEEYRDSLQGHVLLFGIAEVIPPVMAGVPESPANWPPFADVLERARRLGGMVGAAHGATLGRSPTAIADAVLGALDFMEIGNLFIWEPEKNWYRLMNCGYILPPTAGSDLPNAPYRDWWQPFLGSIRTYVKTGDTRGSAAWNAMVKRGEVFVSSGPAIRLAVNRLGPGGTVDLPAGGGEVDVEVELSSSGPLRRLELVRNGKVVASAGPGARSLSIRVKLRVEESSWLAARGVGVHIDAMNRDAVAHTGAVVVSVGGRRIWSGAEARALVEELKAQKEFYRRNGEYTREQDRQRMLEVFDQAVDRLEAELRKIR